MTKKDYILIAEVFRPLVESIKGDRILTQEELRFVINQTINMMGRKLQEDNPRFDFNRFIDYINKAV